MRSTLLVALLGAALTACAASTESDGTPDVHASPDTAEPADAAADGADDATEPDVSVEPGDAEGRDGDEVFTAPDDTATEDVDPGDADPAEPNDACADGCPDAGPFVPEESCDPSKPPILFVHGFLASGDTWAPHAQRFMANGWCAASLRTFDWNTFEQDTSGAVSALDQRVDDLLEATGADQVVLFGHSAGGGLGYDYLADAVRAAKVRQFVYVGSTLRKALPAHDTPTLNLYSTGDAVIGSKGDIPGATNVQLEGDDHFGVATSAASFEACYEFIAGEAPAVVTLPEAQSAWIAGKVVVFGDNAPALGGTLTVWEVDADGARLGAPLHTEAVSETGAFGPLPATVGARYELTVSGVGKSTIHYYREPLLRPNPFVYVRALPGPDQGLAGALLGAIPLDAGKAVTVAFNASRAFHVASDTLSLGATSLLTEESAAPAKTLIALFLYDGDANSATDGEPLELFAGFPFLGARDSTLSAGGSTHLVLNARSIGVRLWDAATEGVSVGVFD